MFNHNLCRLLTNDPKVVVICFHALEALGAWKCVVVLTLLLVSGAGDS